MLRDLQNFSRLQIRLPAYITAENSANYSVTVSVSGTWLGTGSVIQIFPASQNDRRYLYDSPTVNAQLNSANGRYDITVGAGETSDLITFFTSGNTYQFNRTLAFIFEGVQAGRGTITVKSTTASSNTQAERWSCRTPILELGRDPGNSTSNTRLTVLSPPASQAQSTGQLTTKIRPIRSTATPNDASGERHSDISTTNSCMPSGKMIIFSPSTATTSMTSTSNRGLPTPWQAMGIGLPGTIGVFFRPITSRGTQMSSA